MNEIVDINIAGEKHKAMVINTFKLENRLFCIYAIPDGDGKFGIKCGKIIGEQVVDIEDEEERTVVENITKTILYGHKREDFLNMNEEELKFTVTDETGEEKTAHLVGKFEVNKKDYIVYAVEETEEKVGLYIKRVIYNEKGEEESVETITDPEERDIVFNSIRNYIDQEVGDQ